MGEEILTGGNMTPVVRIGESVRRSTGPWTPTIHRMLEHLRSRGIEWVPAPHGLDEAGREVLDFVPGDVPGYPMPPWVWADSILEDAAHRLRQLHDASVDFDGTGALWRLPSHEPAEVLCHNDFAQYNFVFTDEAITGVIDFDTASPGPRIWDLAYLAHRLVPLNDRDRVGDHPAERRRRLALLLDAYGAEFDASETIAMSSRASSSVQIWPSMPASTAPTRLLSKLARFSTGQSPRGDSR